MKVEIHTLRYGNPDWLLECAPTLDAWVRRHGYPLRVWTEEDNRPEYPWPKFCLTEMWRQFAKGSSDWMVYLDADIYVRHDAPAMDFLGSESAVLMPLSDRKTNGRYERWCRFHKGRRELKRPPRWWLRNCGWMAVDRQSVEKLLHVVQLPYRGGTMDECQVNYWLLEAWYKHRLRVKSPPRQWHRFYWRKGPGWMWHIARQHNKMQHLQQIKAEGKI